MKLQVLGRRLHYWLAIAAAIPALVIFTSGVLLQVKKHAAWVQPGEQRGSAATPSIPFDRVLTIARTIPEAGIQEWSDIDRIDVRPSRGILKVTSRTRWELQIDSHTGSVLSSAHRRSDLIESIHDGSWFHPWAKLGVFLPTGVILLLMLGSGLYLFWLPLWVKARRRRASPPSLRTSPQSAS
jgi:uncharacterized iron-regulated membrane protein